MLNNAADSTVLGAIQSVLGGQAHHQQVLLDGYLYRQGGIFREWVRRYVELTDDSLHCFSSKGGMRLSQVKFLPTTQFMDANLRYFCFSLSDSVTGEIVYFAAESSASKETWKEFIITQLSLIQKAHHRKVAKDVVGADLPSIATESFQIRNNYLARPLIYIKIIRARNLTAKDIGGFSDPFVEITVGSSKERTTTRKKSLDPEWGMVFKFDWDPRDRYAKIDVWDEDTLSSHDFLGSVLIPLYSLRDGQSWVTWYPLMKRSSKSTISGEIEIEICCERLPGVDPFIERLYREITMLPEFKQKLLSNPRERSPAPFERSTGKWEDLSEARGFPFYFPPAEIELLEDLSIGATLVAQTYFGRVSSSGVLLLTNFRLLFVSHVRLQDHSGVHRNPLLRETDLTCQIPVSNIIELSLTADPEAVSQINGGHGEVLYIRSIDGKALTFLFNQHGWTPTTESASSPIASANRDRETAIGRTALSLRTGAVPLQSGTLFAVDTHSNSFRLNGKKVGLNISNRIVSHASGRGEVVDQRNADVPSPSNIRFEASYSSADQPIVHSIAIPLGTEEDCDSVLPETTSSARMLSVQDTAQTMSTRASQVLCFLGVSAAWEKLCHNRTPFQIDCVDSEEGGPAARMYTRLYSRRVSRHSERLVLLQQICPLLEILSKACVVQASDRDDILLDGRVPLGGTTSAAGSEVPEQPALTQDNFLALNFTKETMYERIMYNSSLDERATIFSSLENGWYAYDTMAEFNRMGIPDAQWRVSDANVRYELCSTYPALTAVPQTVDDATLTAAAEFRSKNRYPALCWRNRVNYCSIVRCSQPMVGIRFQRSEQDEYLLTEIAKCNGGLVRTSTKITEGLQNFVQSANRKCYVIADARPQLNAVANQAAGKGVENEKYYENATILFLGIPNIHAVRKSLELMDEACVDETSFASKVEQSGWLINISKVLKGVMKIVHCVGFEDLSVVVHCSDGWDRTSQLTSLSMLLLDEYYRTIKGFIVLVEKEWIAFGHKFADRCGWGYEGFKDEERSPIFQQFLDCVHQCQHQIPTAFEFNEDLLLFILEHLQSGWFGDFLFNCEREKREFKADYGGLSMWSIVLHDKQRFTNKNYRPQIGAILPVARAGRMVVWSKWFNSWNDRIWRSAWIQESTIDDLEESIPVAKAWIDDKSVIGCRRCTKLFSLTRRRHHCRRCGHIFCEKCTGETRIVPSVSAWKPSRVCMECATIIDQGNADSAAEGFEFAATTPSGSRPISRQANDSLHHSRSESSLGRIVYPLDLSVGERSTSSGLIDDWNGEY